MRRIPGIILRVIAVLLVVAALTVSGLRLFMPYINTCRDQILAVLSKLSGAQLNAETLEGRWENFGPVINIDNFSGQFNHHISLSVHHVSLALDIWQSLLHAKLQFRDLTFWQLHFSTDRLPQRNSGHSSAVSAAQIQHLFLQRFDHFILRNSTLSFPAISGQQVMLNIPALTWFNEGKTHRAEGALSLSGFTGQHGTAQVRLNLRDKRGEPDSGRIWLQADNIDARPWLGKWVGQNTSLGNAGVDLDAWLTLKEGGIAAGDLLIRRGNAEWKGAGQQHTMQIEQLTAHMVKHQAGWALNIPHTGIRIDGQALPRGKLAFYWQPKKDQLWTPSTDAEIRVRATNIDLHRIAPLVNLVAPLSPDFYSVWQVTQPTGIIRRLAADIPLPQPMQTRFQVAWQNLSWHSWRHIPAMSNLKGEASGRADHGEISLRLPAQQIDTGGQLQAPLELKWLQGNFGWDLRDQGVTLFGRNIDLAARSVAASGEFRYRQPEHQDPVLDILAGIKVSEGADTWRYLPLKIMSKQLVRYLSEAIQGGETQNATLLFAGNPYQFPFDHHQGIFQVSAPLHRVKFKFQPGWPALTSLDIDLDFINNGLWMKVPATHLGNLMAQNITADIADFGGEQLLIRGDIRGQGDEVGNYFDKTELADTLGSALHQVQVKGEVSGRLNLTIPLDGQPVVAEGDVNLSENRLLIKPLSTMLTQVSGRITYKNGFLNSRSLTAQWDGQPLNIRFSTEEREQDFGINILLNGDWQPAKVTLLPASLRYQLSGNLPWQSSADISLPHRGGANYQVNLVSDAGKVGIKLPGLTGIKSGGHIPVHLNASGDLKQFKLSGKINRNQTFITRWLLQPTLSLERGQWQSGSSAIPAMPELPGVFVTLPPLDGDALLNVLTTRSPLGKPLPLRGAGRKTALHASSAGMTLPQKIEAYTPALSFGGQIWRDLSVTLSDPLAQQLSVRLQGKEVKGDIVVRKHQSWSVNLDYLYYNPQWPPKASVVQVSKVEDSRPVDFRQWPSVNAVCRECWFAGQQFGSLKGDMRIDGDKLVLTKGMVDTGQSQLSISGEWNNVPGQQRTALKGYLRSNNLGKAAHWFGQSIPVRDTNFRLGYDMHWQNVPWKPELPTISGLLHLQAGKGSFKDINTGRAGQLLRLISIDALLRKLSLDFQDSFDSGFHYSRIHGTAWIEKGVLRTDSLAIEGLEADITMKGKVDFVQRKVAMMATVVPEISVPAGVAAAFAINPVVGASVFAASKILSPLWRKISLLHYRISGPLDKSEVKEVQRK